jgi:hypothetical protein
LRGDKRYTHNDEPDMRLSVEMKQQWRDVDLVLHTWRGRNEELDLVLHMEREE